MTTLNVLKRALAALRGSHPYSNSDGDLDRHGEAITALRAEIERLESVEPVAWVQKEMLHNDGFTHAFNVQPYAAEGYIPLYTAPAIPEGWLRAIDDAMVVCYLGVAEATDNYETAKQKLHELIQWHIQVATDPCVNGGWQLVPKEPTDGMLKMLDGCNFGTLNTNNKSIRVGTYKAMLQAAPKPEELQAAPTPATAIKPHQIAQLVNELRDIAIHYHDHQSLRERIAGPVRDLWMPHSRLSPEEL